MKLLLTAACLTGLSIWTTISSGQQACRATVKATVEVAAGEFSLADLLAQGTCPQLLRAAARVRLGSAPLAGSRRVLEGDDLRTLLKKIAGDVYRGESTTIRMPGQVPERVVVRRAGARASCADIGQRILEPRDARRAVAESMPLKAARPDSAVVPPGFECGVADNIPQEAPLEPVKTVWEPALGSWATSVRCLHPSDCVPFLVRVRHSTSPDTDPLVRPIATSFPAFDRTLLRAGGKPLVRAGATVTLLWDQYGIRLAVPAISLDPGDEGQKVRARIARGRRIVPAIVVSAGELRTAF